MESEISIEDMLVALSEFIKRDKSKLERMRKELNELLDVPMMADDIKEDDE